MDLLLFLSYTGSQKREEREIWKEAFKNNAAKIGDKSTCYPGETGCEVQFCIFISKMFVFLKNVKYQIFFLKNNSPSSLLPHCYTLYNKYYPAHMLLFTQLSIFDAVSQHKFQFCHLKILIVVNQNRKCVIKTFQKLITLYFYTLILELCISKNEINYMFVQCAIQSDRPLNTILLAMNTDYMHNHVERMFIYIM